MPARPARPRRVEREFVAGYTSRRRAVLAANSHAVRRIAAGQTAIGCPAQPIAGLARQQPVKN